MCTIKKVNIKVSFKPPGTLVSLKLLVDLSHTKALTKLAPAIALIGLIAKDVILKIESLFKPYINLPLYGILLLTKTLDDYTINIQGFRFNNLIMWTQLDLYKFFKLNQIFRKDCLWLDFRTTLINYTTPVITFLPYNIKV